MMRNTLSGLLVFLCVLAGSVPAADGPTPYPAQEKDYPGKGPARNFSWMQPTRQMYYQHRAQDQGAIVFCGDSLTQNWKDLARAFPDRKVANRGIGGDTSRGMLFRFREDVLALQPTGIVILAGINDLTARGSAENALSNIRQMLAQVREWNKALPVIVCTVPASSQANAPVDDAQRARINDGLAELAAGDPHVLVCPLAAALLTPEGKQDLDCYAKDRLHLGAQGYERWKAAILPVFEQAGLLPAKK